jgi:hypothetical protein
MLTTITIQIALILFVIYCLAGLIPSCKWAFERERKYGNCGKFIGYFTGWEISNWKQKLFYLTLCGPLALTIVPITIAIRCVYSKIIDLIDEIYDKLGDK